MAVALLVRMVVSVWPVAVVILVVVLKDVPVIERGGAGMAGMHHRKLPRGRRKTPSGPHALGLVASGPSWRALRLTFPTMSHEGGTLSGLGAAKSSDC